MVQQPSPKIAYPDSDRQSERSLGLLETEQRLKDTKIRLAETKAKTKRLADELRELGIDPELV